MNLYRVFIFVSFLTAAAGLAVSAENLSKQHQISSEGPLDAGARKAALSMDSSLREKRQFFEPEEATTGEELIRKAVLQLLAHSRHCASCNVTEFYCRTHCDKHQTQVTTSVKAEDGQLQLREKRQSLEPLEKLTTRQKLIKKAVLQLLTHGATSVEAEDTLPREERSAPLSFRPSTHHPRKGPRPVDSPYFDYTRLQQERPEIQFCHYFCKNHGWNGFLGHCACEQKIRARRQVGGFAALSFLQQKKSQE